MKTKPKIGIMQGRLQPPVGGQIQAFPQDWRPEFAVAKEAGLDAIEWIYDVGINPIVSIAGRDTMALEVSRTGVQIRSVCADYFMRWPLLSGDPAMVRTLAWVIQQCSAAHVQRLVLPFVDHSSMQGSAPVDVAALLVSCVEYAENLGVELHIETDLSPNQYRGFLSCLPGIKVCYDTGNSASLGYRWQDEFAAYGPQIGSVHIKDRVRGGGTVPLGEGDVDFQGVFHGLEQLGYDGDFILQVARGPAGEELEWARHNRQFVLAMEGRGLRPVWSH